MKIVFFFILFFANSVSAGDYAGRHVNIARSWRDVYGPVHDPVCKASCGPKDPKCQHTCDTALLIKTVTCDKIQGSVLFPQDVNRMFCDVNYTRTDQERVTGVTNADHLYNCFRLHPDQAEYDIFIHEVLCNWYLCQVNGNEKIPIKKVGTWTMHAGESIDVNIYGSRTKNLANSRDFGNELLVGDRSLCDLQFVPDQRYENMIRIPLKLPGNSR